MITQVSEKIQIRNTDFDLGPEWQLDEIELFLKRWLTRLQKTRE